MRPSELDAFEEKREGASSFTISKSTVPAGDSAIIAFTIADTTSWSLTDLSGNSMSPNTESGSGSFSSIYGADESCGDDPVTLTLVGPCGTRTRTLSVNVCDCHAPAPAVVTITSFTTPATVAPGASGTITFAYANGATYSFTSSLGNTFTPPSGSSNTGGSVVYTRDAYGSDTITLTVTGPCGLATGTRVINDPSPVITSFTAPASVAPGASGTITFAYSNGTSYSFTSSLGNSVSPNSGTSTTGGSITYTRDNAFGADTITLTVTGPGGTASQTRLINDPSPKASVFTIRRIRSRSGISRRSISRSRRQLRGALLAPAATR